jgi:hypothetical protein
VDRPFAALVLPFGQNASGNAVAVKTLGPLHEIHGSLGMQHAKKLTLNII